MTTGLAHTPTATGANRSLASQPARGISRPAAITLIFHCAALTILCAIAYLPGLTSHGVTNWQEGIRLIAAREMHHAGTWIVPTIHGQPYLAKPPMIYWAQLALAAGSPTGVQLAHLRLAVAIAGWFGVLATWWAARTLLRDPDQHDPDAEGGIRWSASAAFWAAAMLATGILSTRSARIGELDIMLIAPTALAILGAFRSAQAATAHRHLEAWAWTGLAFLAIAAAALTKGPPAMLTPLIAIIGGTALEAVRAGRRSAPAPVHLLAGATAGVILWILRDPSSLREAFGILCFAAAAAMVASLAFRMSAGPALRATVRSAARTRWPALILVGLAALLAWGAAVERIAPATAESAAEEEFSDNVAVLVPTAPLRGIEVLAYGAGIGSIAALAAVVWIARDRPRLPVGTLWIAAWIVGGFLIFAALSRGTHRYFLPVLPGVAILGAAWITSWFRDRTPRYGPILLGGILLAMAIGNGLWYAVGRERYYASRSPRDFVQELIRVHSVDPADLCTIDFWHPAIEAHSGAPLRVYSDLDRTINYPHPPDPIAELRKVLAETGGSAIVLARAEPQKSRPHDPLPIQRLAELGFRVDAIRVDASYRVDRFRVPIAALRVSVDP